MTERDDERTDEEAASGPAETADEERASDPRQELFEAIDHFKNAANLFFERASTDPTVKQATSEAERVFNKIGERAEPLARQLTGELGRLTRRIQDSVQDNIEGRRRPSDAPPPDDADDDRRG